MNPRVALQDIREAKGRRKLTVLTAYDYPMALAMDKAGLDMILVGDSLANVVLGLDSTKDVTLEQMIYHAKAVRRAVTRAMIIGDMPFEAYQKDPGRAVFNARRFMDEGGCDAVKIEWFDDAERVVADVIKAGIPVMGHIGLTPQTVDKLGGYKVQGKDAQAAQRLIQQALSLQELGCFSVLMECVPDRVAGLITKKLRVPTIGIGAGPDCDGQVLVTHDMIGYFDRPSPKFVKKYLNVSGLFEIAFKRFKADVEEGRFPDKNHSYHIKDEELKKLSDFC
jgi:3-methyl-2-oxobutanoate hydroxymethyltransferase